MCIGEEIEKVEISNLYKKPFLVYKSKFQVSNEYRLFGRPVYHFGCPNFGTQNPLSEFSFFSCISTKKCVELAINNFSYASSYFKMTQQTRKQTEEQNSKTKRSTGKKKQHSTKKFSFI